MTVLPQSRRFIAACSALAIAAGATIARSAEALLPPEPRGGEWIEDTLEDSALWFDSSGNLQSEPIAVELSGYAPGRCWVRIVDGQPAWVMYFVPGEILGFEIDTHHFGAQAAEFTFSAGPRWDELEPTDADFEEITGFEARWMRLYRSAHALPAGTRFLRIEFPATDDRDAARLTEVWLHCRFDDAPPATGANAVISPEARLPSSGAATTPDEPRATIGSDEPAIEPFVVRGIVMQPPPVVFVLQQPVPDLRALPQIEPPELAATSLVRPAEDIAVAPVEPEPVTPPAEAPRPVAVRRRGPPSK